LLRRAESRRRYRTADDDAFELYDLEVEVLLRVGGEFVCGHSEGMAFRVVGEDLIFDGPARFSIYALSALLPYLPAKQRVSDANDWLTTDADIACPDPNCGALFRIHRRGRTSFRHSEVTRTPLN
jgi:uncharacterized repeat protein (TIGR04076 family)